MNDHFQKNYLRGITEYFGLVRAKEMSTGKEARRLEKRIEQRAKMNRCLDDLIRPKENQAA